MSITELNRKTWTQLRKFHNYLTPLEAETSWSRLEVHDLEPKPLEVTWQTICLQILLLQYSSASQYPSIPRYQNCLHYHHFHCSLVNHSKLDYCNSLYHNLSKSQITRLQQIQNSLARAVVKAPKSKSHHSHRSVCALAKDNRAH